MSETTQERAERWTMVRRGERVGDSRPDYVWWHELPHDTTADALRSVGYEVREFAPAHLLDTAIEGLREALQVPDNDYTDNEEAGLIYVTPRDPGTVLRETRDKLREALCLAEDWRDLARSTLRKLEGETAP